MASTREVIWALLLDAPAYPQWNRGVVHLAGDVAAGEHVIATGIDGSRTRFTVAQIEEESRLMFRRTVLPGVASESIVFLLGDCDIGVRVELSQQVSGPLGRLFSPLVPDRSSGMDAFLTGLKSAAEGSSRGMV